MLLALGGMRLLRRLIDVLLLLWFCQSAVWLLKLSSLDGLVLVVSVYSLAIPFY